MASASNLAIRLATAAVGAPAIVLLIYEGPPWGFFILTFVAAMIGSWELFSMTHPGDLPSKVIGVLLSAGVACGLFFAGGDVRVLATIVVAVPLLGPIVTLVRLGDMSTAALRACAMGFGPLFVAVPLTLLAILRRDAGPGWPIMCLGFAWMGDTGGYFAGRFLGKHKLYEAVSPKKTIEGAVGGLAGSVTWAIVCHFFFVKDIPLSHAIPLALAAGALGQAGDLGESLLKRSTGVKDSGQIVPGHGGMLDRVDALIMTSATVFLYAMWFRQ